MPDDTLHLLVVSGGIDAKRVILTMLETIKQKLREHGIEYTGEPSPIRVHCDNCDSKVEYDLKTAPQVLIITLTDSLGGEVFYCPSCGPNSAENIDGVRVVG